MLPRASGFVQVGSGRKLANMDTSGRAPRQNRKKMPMMRSSLLAAAAAFCFAPMAQADHNDYRSLGTYHAGQPTVASSACERQKDSDRLAGGLVGAVAGGLIGAAIGGELEPDNGYHRYRGHRGYRGYHGYRGYRGYGRRHRGYYHDRGDDGAEIAGALVGGLIGAAIGSEVASSDTNCARTYNYEPQRHQPVRSYGSSNVYAPTRSPTGPAWDPPQGQPISAETPAYPSVPAYPTDQEFGLSGGPADTQECTTVRRETRLPDGTVIREPVEVCQTEDGRWQMPQLIPES